MGTFNIIKYLFALVGAALLAGAAALYLDTRSFVADAVATQGTVTALERRGKTYAPVVGFQGPEGTVTFTGSVASRPPAYEVGETVEILYAPSNPNDARIVSTGTLWAAPLIAGGLGTMFFLVGAGLVIIPVLRRRAREALLREGTPVRARFEGVERNTSLVVNGRSPFRVVAQWLDPSTSKVRIFHSENLWFDPTEFIPQEHLTVFVDPRHPKRYCVDLSFLPERED